MNTDQIDNILYNTTHSSPRFGGTYPWDYFAEVFHAKASCKELFVVNTHSSDYEGEHWLAVWRPNNNDKTTYFFDSYGLEARYYPNIERILLLPDSDGGDGGDGAGDCGAAASVRRQQRRRVRSNRQRIQNPGTNVCGDYCVAFCIAMSMGVSFNNFIKYWQQQPNSDNLIRHFVEKELDSLYTSF